MSRFVMVVAAVCFAAGSLISAQGRGRPPGAGGPQITRGGGNAGANVGGGGGRGNRPGQPGKRGGNNTNAGGGKAGGENRDGGNAGNAGGGGSEVGRGNAGNQPGENPGRGNAGGEGRGNEGGRGNAGNRPDENPGRGSAGRGGDSDDDQGTPGEGRGRGGANRQDGDSLVANMNPQQRARLEAMLPSGMSLADAADGFRNFGQFVAAVQQSNNHGISFIDLKGEMTGDSALSLGQAMRKLGVNTDED